MIRKTASIRRADRVAVFFVSGEKYAYFGQYLQFDSAGYFRETGCDPSFLNVFHTKEG